MKRAEPDRVVQEDSDDVWTILKVGDEVETPKGMGTVEAIELALGRYLDEVELEPPHIQVKLEDGSIIQTCLCKLELDNPDDTEIVRSEFERLWPPQDNHVPEDAESTLPDESEESKARSSKRMSKPREFTINGTQYQEIKKAEMSRNERGRILFEATFKMREAWDQIKEVMEATYDEDLGKVLELLSEADQIASDKIPRG